MGTPWPIYDAINGLAEVGRVLLAALTAGYDTAEPGLPAPLRTLTAMIHTRHGNRPGWRPPANEQPSAVSVHPSGATTTGMAHGIAGPLALLTTAHAAGCSLTGQRTAIQNAAHWLLRWREQDAPRWAPSVTGDNDRQASNEGPRLPPRWSDERHRPRTADRVRSAMRPLPRHYHHREPMGMAP